MNRTKTYNVFLNSTEKQGESESIKSEKEVWEHKTRNSFRSPNSIEKEQKITKSGKKVSEKTK